MMRLIVLYFLLLRTIVTETLCGECPRIISENAKIVYKYPEQGITSDQHPIRPGTIAYLECKPFYEYSIAAPDPPNREVTCLEDGTWDLPAFDCVPECGSTTGENIQIVDNSPPGHGTFPWHVGVYHIDWTTGDFEHVCGGSLIGTELVISAAHCYYSDTEKRIQYAGNYAVAAGKLSSSYYETESNQQTSPVQRIYLSDDYEGLRSSQLKDIAILRLAQSFEMTSFVRPVCIDFGNNSITEQFNTGKIAKLMGWGRNARGDPCEELQEISLPNIDHDSCLNTNTENFEYVLTEDETCAIRSEESSMCDADNGSGLCFRSDERWYLGGIVSVISYKKKGSRGRHNDRYYTAFNNVANHTPWIQSVQNDAGISLDRKPCQIEKPQSCILPEPPNSGNFRHESCNYAPGMIFPMGSVLEFNCEKGYFLQGNSTSICQHAVWSPRPTCIKLNYCPSIASSDGLHAVCRHDNHIVTCEREVVQGTKATLQCKDNYRMNCASCQSSSIEITCSANGTWNTNPAVYQCTAERINNMQPCVLPKPPEHGNFEHELCRGSCNYVQGIIFAMGTVLEYNCEKGYSLQGNSTSICQNAVWSSRPTCIQIEYCPPIPSSPNLEAVCQRDDLIVSCELDVVPGTKATLQCADEYRMNFDGDKSRLIGITCSTNGTWHTDPASYHCTPECGIAPVIDNFAHSVNGTEIYAGDVPWPVFTYRKEETGSRGNWCIGPLVKPDLVITQRGCEAWIGFHDTRQDIEELRVADTFDGLLYDDFKNKRSYHQEHSVKNYFVRKHNESSGLNDIEALRLKTPFISKRYLSPLCVDWSLELDIPRAGELGMVFFKIKDKLSRYATLVIDNEECNRPLSAKEHSQITHDEFCIEVPKDLMKHVHFAVRRNGRWYLAGLSHTYHDDGAGRRFYQMAKIGYHMNWVKQV